MASKRKRISNNGKVSKEKDYNVLNLNDVLCPICRSILIEPVSLPCSHEFCLSCFEGTMENANLVCPLCRLRIGSWFRRAKKESKLVNEVFWKVIQNRFPDQIGNKRKGIDENLEETHEIIVSFPGEIRKEYELQKQKDEEELAKIRNADLKASEELIKKLKEEEDYQNAVMEEKLKLDEQVARKLALEMGFGTTSKSKVKLGPMDKFVRKDNETVTSQNAELKKKAYNFANKEYTCRVLCLETKGRTGDRMKGFSPIIKKNIQKIQKITDAGNASDSSDCIESEMRYFKPIDYRLNPPSQGKPPIKIFPKKPTENSPSKILSPAGSINFCSNLPGSAFVRISLTLPETNPTLQPSSNETKFNSDKDNTSCLKRYRSEEGLVNTTPEKRNKQQESDGESEEEKSPVISYNISTIAKRQYGKQICNNIQREDSSSPPFYGFDNLSEKNSQDVKDIIRKNGKVSNKDDELLKKVLQEQADLEFAKNLQEELNRSSHNTRSSLRTSRKSKRQTTLEEIIKSPYRVK